MSVVLCSPKTIKKEVISIIPHYSSLPQLTVAVV